MKCEIAEIKMGKKELSTRGRMAKKDGIVRPTRAGQEVYDAKRMTDFPGFRCVARGSVAPLPQNDPAVRPGVGWYWRLSDVQPAQRLGPC